MLGTGGPAQASLSPATPLPCPHQSVSRRRRGGRRNSWRRANTRRQERDLLEWLERDAHQATGSAPRLQHHALRIDHFHYRPGGGVIAVIAQRHLEAELVVPKQLA